MSARIIVAWVNQESADVDVTGFSDVLFVVGVEIGMDIFDLFLINIYVPNIQYLGQITQS
jgi:hypothetical protein